MADNVQNSAKNKDFEFDRKYLVAMNMCRNVNLITFPVVLIEMITKFSLTLFRWNKSLYVKKSDNSNILELLKHPLLFENNDFTVTYPNNASYWRVIWFDNPIILNQNIKNNLDKDKITLERHIVQNDKNNANNKNQKNKKSVIYFEFVIHELPDDYYDLT